MKKLKSFILLLLLIVSSFSLLACDKTCQHRWIKAECIYPKICILCHQTQGEALGHDFMHGKCKVCGENDPDYSLTLTANVYNVNLKNDNYTVYITKIGGESAGFSCGMEDMGIASYRFEMFDGDTTAISFHPVSSGNTFFWVLADSTKITINISVDKSTPSE